jgi:dihydrofolate synthase/folylpolyglutamate synthase
LSNAAAVLTLLDVAGLLDAVDAELINSVLPALTLAGRSQHLLVAGLGCESNEWLIDVAHNPAAAEVLAKTLGSRESLGATIAIVGLLNDKDVAGVIGPLAEHVDTWVAMTAASHRAVAANELARQISNITGKACLVAQSPRAAIEFARRNASENDRILATGSFFTVGPILDQLTTESRPKT